MNKKITKNTTLSEILKIGNAEKVLNKYGVPCLTCPMAKMELNKLKIGQVAGIYELNLTGILKELNNNSKKND